MPIAPALMLAAPCAAATPPAGWNARGAVGTRGGQASRLGGLRTHGARVLMVIAR